MRIWSNVLLILLFAALPPPAGADQEAWEMVSLGASRRAVKMVAVQAVPPYRVIAATDEMVYESADDGRTWTERFRAPSGAQVTAVAVSGAEPPVCLVATTRGVFRADAGGTSWSQTFRGRHTEEAACVQVAFHPQRSHRALLATRDGLWLSRDGGARWDAVVLPRAARAIVSFAFDPGDPDQLSLVTAGALYQGHLTSAQWRRSTGALSAPATPASTAEEPEDTVRVADMDDPESSPPQLAAVTIDPQHPSHMYLAGSQGLSCSRDGGNTWRRMPTHGLLSVSISRLVLQRRSPPRLYAATARGVARFDPDHESWAVTAGGLAGGPVDDLAASPTHLWAVTAHGLYRAPLLSAEFPEPAPPSAQDLLGNFSHEPTVAQVREAAIRYAEVHPDKIRRWRRLASLQAFLPTVDVGWDRNRSSDFAIDEGTFPKFQLIETEDLDAGVDVSVNWDLGKLLWNDDQTTIDVRSKLMVQLRNDLVDELTRIYFERRRLQVSLLTHPPADPQRVLEQELRIQELTALLDGLTGGFFSSQMSREARTYGTQ